MSAGFNDPDQMLPWASEAVQWKEIGIKAALTGAIAGAATMFLLDNDATTVFAGMEVSPAIAAGAGCAVGSVTADLAHNYILPYIPQNAKYTRAESVALGIAASSLGTYVATMGSGLPISTAAMLGGGSFVAADYTYHNFISMQSGGVVLA